MIIRHYKDDDWPRLCVIHDRARLEELRAAHLVDAFLPLEVAAEREGLFEYDLLIAENEESREAVGFVAYSRDELAWLYVDPACQRKGIGTLLANAALAERPEGLTAEVLQGNRAAVDFYKALGFVETGTASGHMPGNERFTVTVHCLEKPKEQNA